VPELRPRPRTHTGPPQANDGRPALRHHAFLVDWLFEQGHLIASVSALIGALLLGSPIVWTAIKDVQRGILSINELVGIAVLASFASGDYKTAGSLPFSC